MEIDKIIEMIIMLKMIEKMSSSVGGGGGISLDRESIYAIVRDVVDEHIIEVIYFWKDHEISIGIVDEKAYLIPQAISSNEYDIEVIGSVQPYQSQS